MQQPDLLKKMALVMMNKLCALLAEHDLACDFVLLPSNKDVVTVLLSCNSADPTQAHNEEDLIKVGRYHINDRRKDDYVVYWFMRGKEP